MTHRRKIQVLALERPPADVELNAALVNEYDIADAKIESCKVLGLSEDGRERTVEVAFTSMELDAIERGD